MGYTKGELTSLDAMKDKQYSFIEAEAYIRGIKDSSAPALYEALLTALGTITALDNGKGWLSEIYPVIQKALSEAEGK